MFTYSDLRQSKWVKRDSNPRSKTAAVLQTGCLTTGVSLEQDNSTHIIIIYIYNARIPSLIIKSLKTEKKLILINVNNKDRFTKSLNKLIFNFVQFFSTSIKDWASLFYTPVFKAELNIFLRPSKPSYSYTFVNPSNPFKLLCNYF